jgi:N-succinyldiaminopimelate aminotransferase
MNRALLPFATTVFAEMSALAEATGSINLGQGFPDTDGPEELIAAATEAMAGGANQYPPGPGRPELRRAVARHQAERYGLVHDPDAEVLVTTGCTEGIAASLLGLCEPGDEVVVFEPYYDAYAAVAALAGATRRVVPLVWPDWSFDPGDLDAAVTDRTRLLLFNSPHNPTGKVFSHAELEAIAEICVARDLLVVTDEVYEHLVFDGLHRPLATLPGMAGRTVTLSSAGKTFSFTGWKVGWACGPAPLVAAVRAAKQYLTYVSGPAYQVAVARGLDGGDRYLAGVAQNLAAGRDRLTDGLAALGLPVARPAAGYFVTTDVAPLGFDDAGAFCRDLPGRCGVVAVPCTPFFDHPDRGRTLVRWAFCKRPEVLDQALGRLGALAR